MPELPEVETVRRGLAPLVAQRHIDAVHVYSARTLRRQAAGPQAFAANFTGAHVLEVRRRGKYLWLVTDAPYPFLVGHLGMSGQFRRMTDAGAAPERHERARFILDDGTVLSFVDQRTFGWLLMDEVEDGRPASVAHIGPDPFDPGFDAEAAAAALRTRRTGIKRALLDQTLVSGIGNIYADETLWRVRMHPAKATDALTRAAAREVFSTAQAVMSEALAAGGTSFDPLYVNVNGESGWFARSLDAYGREGEPCRRCGRPILREAFTNRSSYRCPRCQRRPKRQR